MSSSKTENIGVGGRLKQVRTKIEKTQDEMADEVGVKQQTWGGYERGKSNPSIRVLQKLAVEHSINLDWLLTGRGDMVQSEKPTVSDQKKPHIYENLPDDFEPKKVSYVPVYGAPLGAGQAGNAAMQEVRGYMAWEKKWLRREARIDPAKAFVAQVYGQSMEDLIENGDLVLGETREVVDHDGIYAVRLDNELFVKHVMRRKGTLVLVSENDVYSEIEISEYDDFSIIGRVVARVGAV